MKCEHGIEYYQILLKQLEQRCVFGQWCSITGGGSMWCHTCASRKLTISGYRPTIDREHWPGNGRLHSLAREWVTPPNGRSARLSPSKSLSGYAVPDLLLEKGPSKLQILLKYPIWEENSGRWSGIFKRFETSRSAPGEYWVGICN